MSVLKRNNVTVVGPESGQPMLFAHGFGCDQHMWRWITPAFVEDYRIVLFDHVGSGGSDLSAYSHEKYDSLQGYADDVLEICHELGLVDVVFVGHSVSAMIGVLAAIAEPERFARLVLVSPSPCYIDDEEYVGGLSRADVDELLDALDGNYLGWSTATAPMIMGNPERPELTGELVDSFCRTDPEIAKHFARVTFLSDNRRDLPNVKPRALVLQCAEDVLAPQRVGEFVAQQLPDSELVLMRATGHCPNLSSPEETVAAMKAFLATGSRA